MLEGGRVGVAPVTLDRMTSPSAAAFWSYAHEDDENEGGAILRLAERLAEEYSLLTGTTFTMFVDRVDIKWGEEWRTRIDHALVDTTFFIPVITNRYFDREECRRELLEFSTKAQSLGVRELVCPILYAPVEGLSSDSPDEAMALIGRTQWEDWTRLRLHDEKSEQHRIAVNKMAMRLKDVAIAVGGRQLEAEQDMRDESNFEGLGDTLDQIRTLLPEWLDTAERLRVITDQFRATDELLEAKKAKLQSGPAGARFAVLRKQVVEYMPLMQRRRDTAEAYLKQTAELSPLVTRAVRTIAAHPEDRAELKEFIETFSDVATTLQVPEIDSSIAVAKWAEMHAHETRGMRELACECNRGDAAMVDAKKLARSWADELSTIFPRGDEARDEIPA